MKLPAVALVLMISCFTATEAQVKDTSVIKKFIPSEKGELSIADGLRQSMEKSQLNISFPQIINTDSTAIPKIKMKRACGKKPA